MRSTGEMIRSNAERLMRRLPKPGGGGHWALTIEGDGGGTNWYRIVVVSPKGTEFHPLSLDAMKAAEARAAYRFANQVLDYLAR